MAVFSKEQRVPTGGPLAQRVRQVAASLQTAFDALISDLAGPTVRPAHLARSLQIDKTLTGKILRAVRAHDAFVTAWEIPAPQGLTIFLDAAQAAGAKPRLLDPCRDATRDYETLLASISGGRAGLEAALAGWIPEVRGRAERIARQTAFRSMSYLMGYQADTLFHSYVLHPASDGKTVDILALTGAVGLRRLRHGNPITVFGMHLGEDHAVPPPGAGRMELLSGEPLSENPSDYLLHQFCSADIPEMQTYRRGQVVRWALPGDAPPIDEPITLVRAVMGRNNGHRYRRDGATEEFFGTVTRTPHKVLIKDIFIHRDLYPDATPVVTTKLQGFVYEGLSRRDPMSALDRVDMTAPVEYLGDHIERFGAREIPRYVDVLHHSIDAAGWDKSAFRAFRCRMTYPVLSLETVMWIDLPPAE